MDRTWRPRENGWSRVRTPLAACLIPAGVAAFIWAYHRAWSGSGWYHEILWLGVVLILAGVYGVAQWSERPELACPMLVVASVVAFSAPKFLRAPAYFNYFDELAHVRATDSLLHGQGFFAPDPI